MEHRLKTPLSARDISAIHAGDVVILSGTIYTARDKAHAAIRARGHPVDLSGAAIYHCGPLISGFEVLAAGPTTSGRLYRYTREMVDLGVMAFIGKGGLPGAAGELQGKAVYLAYPGGCGATAAKQLRVRGAYFEDLGMAEAIWIMDAVDMGPMIVAIDSHGRDLYSEVRESAKKRLHTEDGCG